MIESTEFDGGFAIAAKMAKTAMKAVAKGAVAEAEGAVKGAAKGAVAEATKGAEAAVKGAVDNIKATGEALQEASSAPKTKVANSGKLQEASAAASAFKTKVRNSGVAVGNAAKAALPKAAELNNIIKILLFNLILRVILRLSLINSKKKDEIEHSNSSIGVAIASLSIIVYIQYSDITKNSPIKPIIFTILLYIVILYDVMLPLFKKIVGKGGKITKSPAKGGYLSAIVIIPCIFLPMFVLLVVKHFSRADFDCIIKHYIQMIIIFSLLVFISIAGFFILYGSDINNATQKKIKLNHLQNMKSFYIILMISLFIITLIIEVWGLL